MKEIEFSLGEIQEHMKTYTIDTSLIALRKQLTVLNQQIRHLQLARNCLVHRCEQLENVKEVLLSSFIEKRIPRKVKG